MDARAGTHMAKPGIRLDGEKVSLRIDTKGVYLKNLTARTSKTMSRIKAGKPTSERTALELAESLGTTVEDLKTPISADDASDFLPNQWLYDQHPPSNRLLQNLSAMIAGQLGYEVTGVPFGPGGPVARILEFDFGEGRAISVRREASAFVLEIEYFRYSPDFEQALQYSRVIACRFFPLGRDGDKFFRVLLKPYSDAWIWSLLKETALSNAEVVSIAGEEYPTHPNRYMTVARFYQGSAASPIWAGSRLYRFLHQDFRASLIDFLGEIPGERLSCATTPYGIAITVRPVRPAVYEPFWHTKRLDIFVDQVFATASGELAIAPWRLAHRKEMCEAILSKEMGSIHSQGMPIGPVLSDEDYMAEPLPFAPDEQLESEHIAMLKKLFGRGTN